MDLLIDIILIVLYVCGGLMVVYSVVRLSAIAWLRTKREYETLFHNINDDPPEYSNSEGNSKEDKEL